MIRHKGLGHGLHPPLSGYASGPLNEALGHPRFFAVAFIASWPSLVLVWIVPKTEVEARQQLQSYRAELTSLVAAHPGLAASHT